MQLTTTPMTRRNGRLVQADCAHHPWPTGSGALKPHNREPMPYYGFLGDLNVRNLPGRPVSTDEPVGSR